MVECSLWTGLDGVGCSDDHAPPLAIVIPFDGMEIMLDKQLQQSCVDPK